MLEGQRIALPCTVRTPILSGVLGLQGYYWSQVNVDGGLDRKEQHLLQSSWMSGPSNSSTTSNFYKTLVR